MATTINFENARTLKDSVVKGENVMLEGRVTIGVDDKLQEAEGSIRLVSNNDYIGSYNLTNIIMNASEYSKYRTEASILLDELKEKIDNPANE